MEAGPSIQEWLVIFYIVSTAVEKTREVSDPAGRYVPSFWLSITQVGVEKNSETVQFLFTIKHDIYITVCKDEKITCSIVFHVSVVI